MELKKMGLIPIEVQYMRSLYHKATGLIDASLRDRKIFMYRYGILDGWPHSFGECGKKFGISHTRVSQIVYRLSAKLHETGLGVFAVKLAVLK